MELSASRPAPVGPCERSPADEARLARRRRTLALTLALLLLLLRLNRALGQSEDDVGYRHSLYQEDDHRIKVSTDNWQFDVGLRQNVRVTGEVVMDAISGATPNGAPPPSQWSYVTFNNLFQNAYKANYGNFYNQNIAENQDLYYSNIESYYDLTNNAAQYAKTQAFTVATNSATSAYQTLTNNPNLHRNKVPLTGMNDRRVAFSIALPVTFGPHQVTPSFSYSEESDYISYGGALNYSLALNEKNTLLSAGWSHDQDSVRDDNLEWQPKMTDDILLGLVQLFGPKAYLTVNATLGFEHGYLNDPYRSVIAATNFPAATPDDLAGFAEKRPRHRNSEILYAAWTQFITPLNGSYEVGYRFFHDSYGIYANTLDLNWHQKVGKHLVISPMVRYYIQNAASFYYLEVPDYNNKPDFYSSDYRLSEYETIAGGLTISWRFYKHLSIDAGYTRYVMIGLDGQTSQSAYPSANLYSLGLRGWF
ncbi:MAG: DUF3570 domain-containing protein [Verrucomicrobiae bacterium]|nr:DUF3570 domain-containing protein [Verrucomicrobiae bacterium]